MAASLFLHSSLSGAAPVTAPGDGILDIEMVDPTLPGAALIEAGLRDLATGYESEAALLVLIGAPRLRRLGLSVPDVALDTSPELRLYECLSVTHGNAAHSKYNALIRTLVSFERAAEQG